MKKTENSRWDIESKRQKKIINIALSFIEECKKKDLTVLEVEEVANTLSLMSKNTKLDGGF